MFGKPISKSTKADLDRLIHDHESEGRHLDLKSDFPGDRKFGAWTPGNAIPPKRLHPLLEALVAFANADGGVLVLGMEETEEKPPRASHLTPLPQIVELERRVRDSLNDLIEPHLPFVVVKGIETGDDGSGVLLIETQPSIIGPHWVKPTRGVKIRREDRADPLSMPDIHDMVLRNARRFDEVKKKLDAREQDFETYFFSVLESVNWTTIQIAGGTARSRVETKLQNSPRSFIGIRVTIVPHQSLGLNRLEDISRLVPSGQIDYTAYGQKCTLPLLYQNPVPARRVLGGVISTGRFDKDSRTVNLQLGRDGFVELSLIVNEQPGYNIPLWLLLETIGSALGCYECLRSFAGAASMPGEVEVEILSLPAQRPIIGEGMNAETGNPLEFRTRFPRSTIATTDDFNTLLNELAGDFANAGGFFASKLPRYRLLIREPSP